MSRMAYPRVCDNLPSNSFLHPHQKPSSANDIDPLRSFRKAAKDGDLVKIKNLLKNGVHVNSKLDSYEYSALHYAAWYGKTEAAKLLLTYGANANIVSKDMKTPLHLAASNGYASTIRCLCERGANVFIKANGKTPMDCAERWGKAEALAALKQIVADQEMKNRNPEKHGWRVEDANRPSYPKRVASYVRGSHVQNPPGASLDRDLGIAHVSAQRVGVW
eukprot:CAMPEP_0113664806 /NCGR_PEP_ID=MMETSP0038_2-20120614/1947_1 /TAXON_ID=2898 /ORGANISM="Cryptomonas paramecium" /LENGTH=218 /DNA_ID=CAMNT_0000580075 /DNA_START=126 /DNA_END=779 /DNA_ORIENTATION=- /assembly_acc=CAM_ASM_000170